LEEIADDVDTVSDLVEEDWEAQSIFFCDYFDKPDPTKAAPDLK
jgi:U3 small nucleolar ribonucleoprotein component